MGYDPMGSLAADADLARRRRAAPLASIQPPESLIAELHGLDFALQDTVQDTVTGLDGTVLGFGVEQVQTEE